MTFFDAILSNPTFHSVPRELIEVAFVGRGIESADDYTAAGLKNLELVTADLYLELSHQPKFSEGKLSVEYQPKLLLTRARNIYLKYDDPRITEAGGRTINLNITKA